MASTKFIQNSSKVHPAANELSKLTKSQGQVKCDNHNQIIFNGHINFNGLKIFKLARDWKLSKEKLQFRGNILHQKLWRKYWKTEDVPEVHLTFPKLEVAVADDPKHRAEADPHEHVEHEQVEWLQVTESWNKIQDRNQYYALHSIRHGDSKHNQTSLLRIV